MLHKSDRLGLFPVTTTIEDDAIRIAGQDLSFLAERFGTPLYIYDRLTMDEAVRRYKAALKAQYPGPASITYAGKAFSCKAIAEWAGQQGLQVDCTGEAEIATAVSARLPPPSIVIHGVNKSDTDLQAAAAHAGTIVVDSLSEIRRLPRFLQQAQQSAQNGRSVMNLWLRLQPGAAVRTHHAHTQTGQADSKFGMTPEEIVEAARVARSAALPVTGIHFHQGSNFRDTAPLVRAIALAVGLAAEIGMTEEWHFSPGGGWGAAYHEDELPQPDIDQYVKAIAKEVSKKCRADRLPLPVLHIEPGRSLVARAGVAVYRVGSVKRRKRKTWLLIDGGIADNPRHALYGSRYSCLPAKGLGRDLTETVSIGGPFCESGDVLIEDLRMPRIEEGELIAVPASGAYHLSMASNYNGSRRPAVIWLERDRSRIIVRRETTGELLNRDQSIL